MRIWTIEEEAAALRKRFQGENRAAFARDHEVKGGQAMIYQHITGRRPIGIEAAMAYAAGFNCKLEEISPRLALEAQKAAALSSKMIAPETTESTVWPFPSICEADVRSLSPGELGQLEGAMALAIGQLKLGVDVAPGQPKLEPVLRSVGLIDIETTQNERSSDISCSQSDSELDNTSARWIGQQLGLAESVVVNVSSGELSEATDRFEKVPELADVCRAAGNGIKNDNELVSQFSQEKQ